MLAVRRGGVACLQAEDSVGERSCGDRCLVHVDADVLYRGHAGQCWAVVRQDASATAWVDDHQEPATPQVGKGISVGQNLQAAAGPEFGVSAAERDQVLD